MDQLIKQMQPCYNTIMSNQFTCPWKDEEIQFLEKNIGKLTYNEMGYVLHRSYSSIQSKIRFLPFQRKIKKHLINSDFFKVWSPEMAYVVGFIAADGNICKSGRSTVLHIACDNVDVIEKIKLTLNYEGPIYTKKRSNGKTSHSLRICDYVIFQDLQKLNITERKSLTLMPPKIPRNLVNHFIRGYFDGDGSVSIRSRKYPNRIVIDVYTASPYMADFLYSHIKTITKNSYAGTIRKTLTH